MEYPELLDWWKDWFLFQQQHEQERKQCSIMCSKALAGFLGPAALKEQAQSTRTWPGLPGCFFKEPAMEGGSRVAQRSCRAFPPGEKAGPPLDNLQPGTPVSGGIPSRQ